MYKTNENLYFKLILIQYIYYSLVKLSIVFTVRDYTVDYVNYITFVINVWVT